MLTQGQSASYKVRSFSVISESPLNDRIWCVSTDGVLDTDVRKNAGSIVTDDSKQTLCPNFYENAIIWAAWDPVKKYWIDLNVDARRMVEHTDCNEFPDKLVAAAGTGAAAASNLTAGNKGEKGASGLGTQGEEGDKGTIGSQGTKGGQGDQGAKGSQGIQGDEGDQGSKGNKGNKGENVDLSSSPVVKVDGVEFGARLMGICVNGEWKYVYVFASTPETV